MTEKDDPGAPAVDDALPLGDDVELQLEMNDEGDLRVSIVETHDGFRAAYSASHSADFYTSRQKVATIANELEEHLSDEVEALDVKRQFKQICSQLSSKHEEVQEKFQTPTVNEIIEQTRSVEIWGGQPTTITVTLEKDGVEREIEFTSGEWVAANAHNLKERYYDAFYERLEISTNEWNDLTEEWDDMAVKVGREETTERGAIVSSVVEGLKGPVKPVDEKDGLKNDKYAAWYQEETEHIVADGGAENADVLWVRSEAVKEQLDKVGKQASYIGELSKGLADAGHTYGSTKTKGGQRVWPFDPEAVGVSPVDTDDDEDHSEVEP